MKSGIISNIRLKEKKCRNKMQQARVFRVDELLKSHSKNQIGFFSHARLQPRALAACMRNKKSDVLEGASVSVSQEAEDQTDP